MGVSRAYHLRWLLAHRRLVRPQREMLLTDSTSHQSGLWGGSALGDGGSAMSEWLALAALGLETWGNPDCDAGYHARTQVTFRRWPFIWRVHTEWRCWNCDWALR